MVGISGTRFLLEEVGISGSMSFGRGSINQGSRYPRGRYREAGVVFLVVATKASMVGKWVV